MTQHVLTIPSVLLTVAASPRTFPASGGFNIGNNTTATISIDRTVANGLDAAGAGATLSVTIQSSPDGGTTWQDEAAGTWQGGPYFKNGVQRTTADLGVEGLDGGRNSCRVITAVTGVSIRIAGTVTVN